MRNNTKNNKEMPIIEDESSYEKSPAKYWRTFNPVLIFLVLLSLIVFILSINIELPYLKTMGCLFFPGQSACLSSGGKMSFYFHLVTYSLEIIALFFYIMVLGSDTKKQFFVGSILGIIFMGIWFIWAVLMFVVSGLRPH